MFASVLVFVAKEELFTGNSEGLCFGERYLSAACGI